MEEVTFKVEEARHVKAIRWDGLGFFRNRKSHRAR